MNADQDARLLHEAQSLNALVRKLKAKGYSADETAKKIMAKGGYDADHVGSVIVKVYGRRGK